LISTRERSVAAAGSGVRRVIPDQLPETPGNGRQRFWLGYRTPSRRQQFQPVFNSLVEKLLSNGPTNNFGKERRYGISYLALD
jgi:hypothetical protein